MTDDARQLLELARRRDSEAIAELYHQYAQKIARYIYYRVSDSAVVEDLTANVFLIMVEKLPRYQDTGAPFEAWLYRIASAQVADYYRTLKKRPQETLPESHANGHPSLETMVQDQEYRRRLQLAINQLSEQEQTILFLRFVERKKHEEVAQKLGKTPQAVAVLQHRALKRLAAMIERGE